MVRLSKEEMKRMRERFPKIQATRTVHRYYIEERPEYMAFLKNGTVGARRKHA